MFIASKIRKDLLKALDESIIPVLQNGPVTQVLAEPPFEFSSLEYHIEQKKVLPNRDVVPLQVIRYWKKEQLCSLREPSFRFVYTGVSYERIGVMASVARKLAAKGQAVPGGILVVPLPAPGVICFPGHVLQNDGAPRPQKEAGAIRTLNLSLMGGEVFVALSERRHRVVEVTHNLEVRDPILVQMSLLYLDELRERDDFQGSQVLLLALMYRLKRYLLNNKPRIGNTCWPDPALNPEIPRPITDTRKQEQCREIMDYIQMHLHLPLSLKMIASHFDVSTLHLNRIFRQVQGTSVMRYVTVMRIMTARQILIETPERVSDVAKLVGFSGASSFCTVFRKHTGLTPNEFRQQERATSIA